MGVVLLLTGCLTRPADRPGRVPDRPDSSGYAWDLPPGFPPPLVPDDNPMSAAKVELGRRLFYDPRLSGNQTMSCANCHRQELAFTDGQARAVGSTGETHPRSAMSLVNVAYSPSFNWADPGLDRLEDQIEVPMFNQDPVELGLTGRELEVEQRLRDDPEIADLFTQAFAEAAEPVGLDNTRKALASFVRTIVSARTAWDQYAFWDAADALTGSERRGMELFFSERTLCSRCHPAPLFAGDMRSEQRPETEQRFHNTGLYDLDGEGAYPPGNQGLIEHTARAAHMGRFKAPTLRNVELTAPYMHDGSIETLKKVIDFYATGGRGPGRDSPLKDPLVGGFEISENERADLLAFLATLTDQSAVEDPRWRPPE